MHVLPISAAHVHITASVHGWRLAGYIGGAILLGALFLFGLMSVPPRFRKILVAGITFITGLYFSLEFLLPHSAAHLDTSSTWFGWLFGALNAISRRIAHFAAGLTGARGNVADWALVIGSFAVLLGISNLFAIHGKAVRKKAAGWYNSLAFFISFFLIMIFGFLKDQPIGWFGHPNPIQNASQQFYSILFYGFVVNLDATMFSLIAFYIVSAAYRAFRVRSAEAGLMMATAAIIMLGLVPVGAAVTNWLPRTGPHAWLGAFRLESITYWLLLWPNMAVQRAINFGLMVGALAMSLRIWLSLEKGSYFDRQL